MVRPTPRSPRPAALACVLVALALVSAACNSTNRLALDGAEKNRTDLVAGEADLGADAVTDTTSVAEAAAAAAAAAGIDPVTGKPRPAGPATAPGATTGGPGATVPLGGGPSAGFVGPGVTATEIKIGITLVEAGEIFGDVTGVPVDFGNTELQAQAVVDHVNKTGGIAGRKVVPVYYKFDLSRAGLSDGQSEQEACAKWTEDNRVFAGSNTVLARQSLLICLAKRGVPALHNGMPIDEDMLKSYRNFWYTSFGGSGLTLDRLAEKQVKAYAAQGFFGSNAVVGIEHFDDPAYKRVVDQVFRPQLAAVGVKRVVTAPAPRAGIEGASSYAINFRNEGVTHVLFFGEGGLYPLFFLRAAENQRYFPKYGLHTDHALAQLLQEGAPQTQLANANVIGWTPAVDVDGAHDPGPVSARNALCLDIQKKAGQDMSNRGALVTAIGYCEGLFLLKDALAPVREITVAGLAAGFAALGASYSSAGTFSTRFSAVRRDGVDAYRDMKFTPEPGCKCFTYTSAPKVFPG